MSLLVIDRQTVHDLLPMDACIALMTEAMIALSQGRTRQVLRQIIPVGGENLFGVMPGAAEAAFGAKLISVYPGNFDKGLQSHQGFVALFDPATGAPEAMLHAGEITAIRTAAASAAATQVLARHGPCRLALLGYGEQALTHARAMTRVRTITSIRVWGRSLERARAFAAAISEELGVPAAAHAEAEAAVRDADIVCTVTPAREPILRGEWVAPGTHVNLVGASTAAFREADDALVARGRLFADHREGALAQGGEIQSALAAGLISEAHVLGEIGQVMDGTLPGRTSEADVTLYKSLGSVVQDLWAGRYVAARARAEGRGVSAPF